MHAAVQHYFDNGGEPCFVVSVAEYTALAAPAADVLMARVPAAVARVLDINHHVARIAKALVGKHLAEAIVKSLAQHAPAASAGLTSGAQALALALVPPPPQMSMIDASVLEQIARALARELIVKASEKQTLMLDEATVGRAIDRVLQADVLDEAVAKQLREAVTVTALVDQLQAVNAQTIVDEMMTKFIADDVAQMVANLFSAKRITEIYESVRAPHAQAAIFDAAQLAEFTKALLDRDAIGQAIPDVRRALNENATTGGPVTQTLAPEDIAHAVSHALNTDSVKHSLREAIAATLDEPPQADADSSRIGEAVAPALSAEKVFAAVAQAPTLTLMAVPDLALLPDHSTEHWRKVWRAMLDACEARRGLFCLIDTPADPQRARTCLDDFVNELRNDDPNLTRLANGAAYWPRLKVVERKHTHQMPRWLPPSAAVAAQIQRTDREVGVWKAPANAPLGYVVQPQYPHWAGTALFDDAGESINLIRSFPGRGIRVWGCRTLAGPGRPHERYVQTQRLGAYITSSLTEIGRFVVFEPNNEITWFKFKGLASAWLRSLWRKGGLFGSKEEHAFRVLLGLNETMTREDVLAGRMIVQISVALRYPAEFVDLTLQFATSESHARASEAQLNGSVTS
ncbi:hypothetical protein WM23_07660 [Burkholderia ubonensis]|nr:hypothetical protein WM23_07660 [Burkholderia ubonensis]